jgi:hypothetical protein
MELYKAPVELQIDNNTIFMTANKSLNLKVMGAKMLLSDGKYLDPITPQWLLDYSSLGTLVGDVYTAPNSSGIERIVGYYTLNGLTKMTTLTITVDRDGTVISLSPSSIQVAAGETYDLKTIAATIEYVEGLQSSIVPTWTIASGGGTIVDGVYTAPVGAEETHITASHPNLPTISNATLYINRTEASNAMNITSNDFTYTTDIGSFLGRKFDLSVAVTNGTTKCIKEFKMVIFDTTNYELTEVVSANVTSSVTITPSIDADHLKVNVVDQNGGKMTVTISNIVSAVAA